MSKLNNYNEYGKTLITKISFPTAVFTPFNGLSNRNHMAIYLVFVRKHQITHKIFIFGIRESLRLFLRYSRF